MIEYREEKYDDVIGEIKPLLENHYEEIALDRNAIKLNPDYEAYKRLDELGIMSVVTARDNGKLIGYCVCFIKPHIHYKDSLTAFNDIFYISKEYRKGLTGVKLFIKTEEILKNRGVQRVSMNVKLHKDVGVIFERLGYKETERIFTKLIG